MMNMRTETYQLIAAGESSLSVIFHKRAQKVAVLTSIGKYSEFRRECAESQECGRQLSSVYGLTAKLMFAALSTRHKLRAVSCVVTLRARENILLFRGLVRCDNDTVNVATVCLVARIWSLFATLSTKHKIRAASCVVTLRALENLVRVDAEKAEYSNRAKVAK